MDRSELMGERRLAQAVLEQALDEAIAPADNETARRRRHEARAWLNNDIPGRRFSSEFICQVLGIDREAMRSAIQNGEELRVKRYHYKRSRGLDEF